MGRPKGSKNKKSTKSPDDLTVSISAQKAEIEMLNDKQEALKESIKDLQTRVKTNKADIREAEKKLAGLLAKKEKMEIKAEAVAKKAEIEQAVTALVSSGKSAEEILEKLK